MSRDYKGGARTVPDGFGGRRDVQEGDSTKARGSGGASDLPAVIQLLPTPGASDTRGQDYARANREGSGGDDLVTAVVKSATDFGKYTAAVQRWEALTRPAPSPTEPNTKGNPRLNPAFSEWMMGWPDGWVTGVPGLSRNDRLRAIGNGVVPQQAAAAIRALLTLETEIRR